MADARLERTRKNYHPCEIGAKPHRYADYFNGRVMGHAFRDGITYERRCSVCGAPDPLHPIRTPTPREAGLIAPPEAV